MTKTIFTLSVNGYAKEITDITYPYIKRYAKRIGAEFVNITERKFPDYPVVYEKFQVYQLAKEMKNDWNIYIDSDTLIHPETIDFTEHLSKDTVCQNGHDMGQIRWKPDNYFRRDGRWIGTCNWFTLFSDWCIDMYHPLEDMSIARAIENCTPTVGELNCGLIDKLHLVDDYIISRNVARYGLKYMTIQELLPKIGLPNANFFYHEYTIPTEEKVKRLKKVIIDWGLDIYEMRGGYG